MSISIDRIETPKTTPFDPLVRQMSTSSSAKSTNEVPAVEAEPSVDAPSEESKAIAPKEELLSSKYAAIARRDAAIRRRDQELKAKEEALKAKESEYATEYIPKSKLKERFANDPMGLMTEFGLTYDQLTNLALNQPGPESQTIQELKAEVRALREEQGKTASKIDEQKNQAYQQAIRQIGNDVKLLIDGNPDFETIRETNSADAVVELIEETFKENGIVLSVEEAAKEIENHLVEDYFKKAQLRKVRERISPPQVEATAVKTAAPQEKTQPQMKTLTNAVGATSRPRLTERDRVERAKLAFMGQLK